MTEFEISTLAAIAENNGLTPAEALFLPSAVSAVIKAAPSISTTLAAVNEMARNAELAAYLCGVCRTSAARMAAT